MVLFDYVIVGGGISGLYANYILSKKYNGLLLEKESYFGGRAHEKLFHGSLIKLGAGVINNNNENILKLLKKLKIKPKTFISGVNSLLDEEYDMDDAIKKIKQGFNKHKSKIDNLTVKQFLTKYFGTKFTADFIANCKYHDYLESSVEYFIKYYDIHDMTHRHEKIFYIYWTDLINTLETSNCKHSYNVDKIKKLADDTFLINNDINTRKIIMATTLKPLNLLNKLIDFKYSDYVGTVPFVRIYTWHKDGYDASKIKGYNIVKNELQKILMITDKILMVSYSDNDNAEYWKKILGNDKKTQIKKVTSKLKELKLNIETADDIEIVYWNEGIHYYKPFNDLKFSQILKKLSNPADNIHVIGEIVSRKQGWVEGCIESVNRLI